MTTKLGRISPPLDGPRPDPRAPLRRGRERSTVLDPISEQIAARPACVAISSEKRCYTYGELGAMVDATASWLVQLGLSTGAIVAVHSGRSADLVPALLGVWKAGLAFVIIDSSYPHSAILERLRLAGVKAWIDVEQAESVPLTEYLRTEGIPRCTPDNLTLSGGSLQSLACSEQLAYLAFTSGSTGAPRGVLGAHFPLAHFLSWQIGEFDLGHKDRFAMLSGISHDPLLRDFFTPLSLGATLYVPGDDILADPRQFASWMNDHQISVAHLTPARAQILLIGAELQGFPLTSVRYLFFGGELLPKKSADACLAVATGAEIVNFYGATETPQAMGFYRYRPDRLSRAGLNIPLGRGIDGVQLLVTGIDGKLCEIGEEGEICIRTPYLSMGYLNDAAATRERFVKNLFTDNPDDLIYKTGDLGVFLPDGNVEFHHRKDRQIKIRGYRVEPYQIESAMESHPAIQRAIVVPIEYSDGNELAGCFMTQISQPILATELRQYLATRLPQPLIPARILKLDQFPMTPNGKVDRAALKVLVNTQGNAASQDASPLESWLMACWCRTLGVGSLGLDDEFFASGGTSIAAARIIAEVERKVSFKVPLSLLIGHSTVRKLAAKLETGDVGASWNTLILLNQGDKKRAPFFLVHAIGGNVVGYSELSRQLADRPVYALQSLALNGGLATDTTIEQMASRYVGEIRTVQKHGPYHLGGFSAGGLVAFEMAYQLRAMGEQVGIVCLLDTQSPLKTSLFATVAEKIRKNLKTCVNLTAAEWKEFVATKSVNLRMNLRVLFCRLKRGGDATDARDKAEVQFRLACQKYCPKLCDGRVVLFQTAEENRVTRSRVVEQWTSLTTFDVEVREVAGNHETMLLKPNVEVLAKGLREVLDQQQLGTPING